MFDRQIPTQPAGTSPAANPSAVGVIVAAAVLVLVLWQVPGAALLFYPFKLFVTFVHEACHGMAAVLTGGWWQNFQVFPDGSGVAWTAGGFRPLVISAGYLGSSVFGALMLIAAARPGAARPVLLTVAALLAVITAVYGSCCFGLVSGLALAAGLAGLAWLSRGPAASLLLAFLAVLNSLYALTDLQTLIVLSSSARYGGIPSDAQNMAQLTGRLVPAVIWAVLWALMALAILGLTLRYLFRRRPA